MDSLIVRIMQDVRKNLYTGNFDDHNIKILCYDGFTLTHPSESNNIYIAYTSPNILYQFDLYSTMAKITLDVSNEPIFIAVRDVEYTEESLFQYSMINDIGDLTLEEINVIVGMCRLINP
ncbi:hypothetical protein K0M00_005689 [Escherichia coli]|nr:hypothetical protein [Escherichia coli]